MTLGIYGAGGLGREVDIVARKINAIERRWKKIIYIDDDENIREVLGVECRTLDEARQEHENFEISIAVGEPGTREAIFEKVKDEDIGLATLVHPGVFIDGSTEIGEGCVICEGVTITSCVEIGSNTYVHPHAVIGHDVRIGRHCVIGTGCEIGGANAIGDRSYFGFLSGTKELLGIGKDVICSAGAIVFRDLPDGVIAVGNPARIMRENKDKTVFRHTRTAGT